MGIIFDVIKQATTTHTADSSPAKRLSENTQTLELKNISFTYPGIQTPFIRDLSLTIPLGKTIAIVGKTGSGKSTIIDIIMGLLIPQGGEMRYYGNTVSNDALATYHGRIGYVPQQIYLIDDTIEANIAFGCPQEARDPQRIYRAIQTAQLRSFIDDLPEKEKTIIGERGVRLSGGQKQRLSIARAFYRQPEILILDEATSALDAHTESEVFASVKTSEKPMTVIIVSHRVNSLEHADVIYVVDAGRIVSSGTYAQLSASCQIFKELAQTKEKPCAP